MAITEEQYQRLSPLFPAARRKPKRSNREVRNAVRYLAAPGCPGRGLPESYGNWPTVYMRWSRWQERGTLTLIFAARPELRGNRIKSCTGGAMRGSGFFGWRKGFRRIFPRYDPRDPRYRGFVRLACSFELLRRRF